MSRWVTKDINVIEGVFLGLRGRKARVFCNAEEVACLLIGCVYLFDKLLVS